MARSARLPVLQHDGARVEPCVVLEEPLRAFDRMFQRVERTTSRFVPDALDPLKQTGAIANTSLIIAIVSGVLLLVWYSSSVHSAHESMRSMGVIGTFVRSMHRYSSDACMLFVLVHALQIVLQRRFGGARWLAWVTGAFLVGTLWLVGWLGYWLTWDERARQVAIGTAHLLDALPLFADPLSRSFLTDDGVGSLVFFIVFFFHMLVPLAMGVALWLHITRLSRPEFLASKTLTAWIVGTLALLCVLLPADLAAPARMTVTPQTFSLDAWYLVPMWFTDRLGAGALWALVLVGGVVTYSIPWTLARGRAERARVATEKCNACERCVSDCPYDAIRMAPRGDPSSRHELVAKVDPDKCLGCGICAGSCDSAGIGLEWFDVLDVRERIDRERNRSIAFVCAESVRGPIDGCTRIDVPCIGWVHALTVERAFRHGGERVLLVGCGSCTYREGPKWANARMSSQRKPALNLEKVDRSKVSVVELFSHERVRAVASRKRAWVGIPIALLVGAITWAGSRAPYVLPSSEKPELVVSFKHPGVVAETCRDLTDAEKKKLPPHMRPPKVCERGRVAVRMRVFVDDVSTIDRSYAPSGLWSDGNSMALERVPITIGKHRVRVEIGDTADTNAWPYVSEQEVEFVPHTTRVVRFDKIEGYTWR